MNNKIDTTCEHIKLRLIAAAVGLQQCTKTDVNIIPLPGTKRLIFIGEPAAIERLIELDRASALDGQAEQHAVLPEAVRRPALSTMADTLSINPAADLADSEGGHHD